MISVIIPTYNRPQSLDRTLEGIYKSKVKPKEVVIIDQSEDENIQKAYYDVINKYTDSNISIVYFRLKPASLTAARNEGARIAKEEIFICMDDDVDIDECLIGKIEDIMSDKNIALIAGLDKLSTEVKDKFTSYFFGTKDKKKSGTGYVTKSILGRYPMASEIKKETPAEWAMGYFFVVRKSLIDKFDIRWDENLKGYAYAEDLDFSVRYCRKAKELGLRCIISPRIIVEHLASKEYRIEKKEHIYKYIANREYIYNKIYKNEFSRFHMIWTNFWMLVFRILKRNNAKVFFDSICLVNKNRNNVDKGIFKQI